MLKTLALVTRLVGLLGAFLLAAGFYDLTFAPEAPAHAATRIAAPGASKQHYAGPMDTLRQTPPQVPFSRRI